MNEMTSRALNRVVVTGMGIISPVGSSVNSAWANILAGKSGVRPISDYDASALPVRFRANVIDFNSDEYFSAKEARKMDTFVHYGMAAGIQAIQDSGIDFAHNEALAERSGIIIGSGIGGLPGMLSGYKDFLDGGARRVSPFYVPANIINMISGNLSIRFGLKGPALATATACASATHSIAQAYRMIQLGDADVMVAGGAEMAGNDMGIAGFAAAKALSTHPEGNGAARCIRNALRDAQINPEQIDYINAHGTSTPIGDLAETQAIKQAMGDAAYRTVVSSTKSMTGHALGAAGGLEAVFTLLALRDGKIPPTINLDNPGEGCNLDYCPHTARDAALNIAMSNSFGFGGTNATLIFRRV